MVEVDVNDFTPADMKAVLAKYGQTMQPEAKITYLDLPKPDSENVVVVLDRVVEGDLPPYCTHGYATCVRCHEPCWIGHKTSEVLLSGEAYPICVQCAAEVIPKGTKPERRIEDHLRADGPHE